MEGLGEIVQGLIASKVSKSFVGDFPSLDTEGVSIKLGQGEESTRFLGMTVTISRPYIVLVAKSATYQTGEGWLKQVRTTLDGYHSGAVLSIVLATPPLYLGRDEQKMHEFQVTYKVLLKE